MRKVVLMFFLSMVLAASGQRMVQTKTLGNWNFGCIKFKQSCANVDTLYMAVIKTTYEYEPNFVIGLGNRHQAEHFLKVLSELRMKGEDMMMLENPSNNYIRQGTFGSLRIFEELGVYSVDVHRDYFKKMLKLLDDTKAGKQKKPAYMRNMDSD